MSSPLVSVLLPVRNAAATLSAALDSVLAQTFGDFEVIAVDDGSTDESAAILRQFADREPRIRLVSTPAIGTTPALNLAASRAAGRYFARQDADDLSMPSRFARQVEALDGRATLGAIGTAAMAINHAGETVARFPTRHGTAAVHEGLRTALATPVHGSMMIRREAFEAAGGYRDAFVASQDFDLWLRLIERCRLDNLEEPLYHWRVSAGAVHGERRWRQLMFGGIALAFSAERARVGADSYALLERSGGDLVAFSEEYRLGGQTRAIWGELLLRAGCEPALAHEHFVAALRLRPRSPRALVGWAWTALGLGWPGGKPIRA
jgi:glycosyltransferase involved in cell wall biosynthesis